MSGSMTLAVGYYTILAILCDVYLQILVDARDFSITSAKFPCQENVFLREFLYLSTF